jgi:hypothetical protein
MREHTKQEIQDLIGNFTVVEEVTMLYAGWECDSDGWLVRTDGQLKLILTDHGRPYVADGRELRDQISTNLRIVEHQRKVLAKLEAASTGSGA